MMDFKTTVSGFFAKKIKNKKIKNHEMTNTNRVKQGILKDIL